MTDETEVVQPDAGQGDGGQAGDPPYAEYLTRIPEEARGPAEEAFKAWDADVTRKFTEASEYRKGLEPYEQLGIRDLSPDEVQWALDFRKAAVENPQSVWEWAQDYAKQHDLTPQETAALEQQAQVQADEFGFTDPQQLEQLLEKALDPIKQDLQSVHQWREQQEQQAQVAQGQAVIDEQLAEIKSKHESEFTDKAQNWVMSRAQSEYLTDPEHAIPRAWADYQELVSSIETQLLQAKANAPSAPEGGGLPNVAVDAPQGFPEARQRALEILQRANSQQ